MKLRIGSRESRLAVIQSRLVMEQIHAACPELELELVTMKTTGDRVQDRTLEQIGGKGLFVKELDRALLDGRVDLTVHSLKDLPMEIDPAIPIVACTRREDPRDVLVLREGETELDPEGVIGCASKRRTLQLRELYPRAEVRPVRGNIQTRLAKLDRGEYSALVLAAAGLRRLGLEERISRCFSTEEMLPAAGQGILAVQARQGMDTSFLRLVRDEDAGCCARAERAFVRELGGGCTSPTAAYAETEGENLTISGLYAGAGGEIFRRGTLSGKAGDAEKLGAALAGKLKEDVQ